MVRATCILASCALMMLLSAVPSSAYPSYSNYYREDGQYDPEEFVDMLGRLQNYIQYDRRMDNFKDDITSYNNYYRDEGQYEPKDIVNMLGRLQNLIQFERKMETLNDEITSEKRALDLGLSRGYSGALQAKHMLGVAAANSAFGPGRRRRDAH